MRCVTCVARHARCRPAARSKRLGQFAVLRFPQHRPVGRGGVDRSMRPPTNNPPPPASITGTADDRASTHKQKVRRFPRFSIRPHGPPSPSFMRMLRAGTAISSSSQSHTAVHTFDELYPGAGPSDVNWSPCSVAHCRRRLPVLCGTMNRPFFFSFILVIATFL